MQGPPRSPILARSSLPNTLSENSSNTNQHPLFTLVTEQARCPITAKPEQTRTRPSTPPRPPLPALSPPLPLLLLLLLSRMSITILNSLSAHIHIPLPLSTLLLASCAVSLANSAFSTGSPAYTLPVTLYGLVQVERGDDGDGGGRGGMERVSLLFVLLFWGLHVGKGGCMLTDRPRE